MLLSSQVGQRRFGIELVQHREGPGIGRPVAHRDGEVVQGTAQAIRQEIKDAFSRIKGGEGENIRLTLANVAAEMRARRRSGGVWDEDLKRFIQWARTGGPSESDQEST